MDRTLSLDEASKKVLAAIQQFAAVQGWEPWDYRVEVRESEWDSLHAFLAARTFKREEGFAERNERVLDYLQQHLDRDTWNLLGGLETMTYEEWDERGLPGSLAESFKETWDEAGMTPEDFYRSFREWLACKSAAPKKSAN